MAGRLVWALCGVAAAAVAIGVGELVAALLGNGSIISAVGAFVISLQPPGAKDLMVTLFGTNDKLALEVGTLIGGLLVGGLLGLVARRDRTLGLAGFFFFGLAAFVLLQGDPLNGMIESAVTAVAAVLAGGGTLMWLSGALVSSSTKVQPARSFRAPPMDRRGFLALSAVFIAAGGVLAVIGRYLGGRSPDVASPDVAIPVPAGTDLGIAGLTPIVVPNSSFYRIDTRLDVPRVDETTWNLRIHGMVDREIILTYADLQQMAQQDQFVTIACVSNEVGGRLVGNALWSGVKLVPVLESAGVSPEATQLVGRSFDGWTAGFPTEHLAGAGKDAMIALQMNREPLPAAHGFPARLIVPGLFGYVSATKWITEIELTTLEAFDAYWVKLGWSKLGPILTQSRIDVPRPGAQVPIGPVEVAGVAWAPTRGISKVEVHVDSGDWVEAELSAPLSTAAWVQWRATIDVAGGPHVLMVRATDGTGETQDATRTPPVPSGARGYHTVTFSAG
jgi:DMSO/TMAO reductase YedYZ molybdopterin-dependent catalytic subunit